MRNLKKFLALVLAMMMAFSLMVTANAAANEKENGTYQYADETVSDEFTKAVDVLYRMGIMTGDNGSFYGDRDVMRSEMSAVLYRLVTGDTTQLKSPLYASIASERFSDVNEGDWFAPYIGYCYSAGLVKGYDGKFNPWGYVNGHETLIMVLRAMGFGKEGEYEGAYWSVKAASDGTKYGLLDDVDKSHYANTLTQNTKREVVASIVFNGAIQPTATWTPALGYNQYDGVTISGQTPNWNPTLGQIHFGLTSTRGIIVGNQSTGESVTRLNVSASTTPENHYKYDPADNEGTIKFLNWTTDLRFFGHDVEVWYDGGIDGTSNGSDARPRTTYAIYDRTVLAKVVKATEDTNLDVDNTVANKGKLGREVAQAGFKVDRTNGVLWDFSFGRIDTDSGYLNVNAGFASPIDQNNSGTAAPYYLVIANDKTNLGDKTADLIISLDLTVTRISQNSDDVYYDEFVSVNNGVANQYFEQTESDDMVAIKDAYGVAKGNRVNIAVDSLGAGSTTELGADVVAMMVAGTDDTETDHKQGQSGGKGNYGNGTDITKSTFYHELFKLTKTETKTVVARNTTTQTVTFSDGTTMKRSWLADTVADNRLLDLGIDADTNTAANVARTVAPTVLGTYTFTVVENAEGENEYVFWSEPKAERTFIYGTYLDYEQATASSTFKYPMVGVIDGVGKQVKNVTTGTEDVAKGDKGSIRDPMSSVAYEETTLPKRDALDSLGAQVIPGKYQGFYISDKGALTPVAAANNMKATEDWKQGDSNYFGAAKIDIGSRDVNVGAVLAGKEATTNAGLYLTNSSKIHVVSGTGTDTQKVTTYNGIKEFLGQSSLVTIHGEAKTEGSKDLDANLDFKDMIYWTQVASTYAQDYTTTAWAVDEVYIPAEAIERTAAVSNLFFIGDNTEITLVNNDGEPASQFTMYDAAGNEHSIWMAGLVTDDKGATKALTESDGNGNFFLLLEDTGLEANDGQPIYTIRPVSSTADLDTLGIVGRYVQAVADAALTISEANDETGANAKCFEYIANNHSQQLASIGAGRSILWDVSGAKVVNLDEDTYPGVKDVRTLNIASSMGSDQTQAEADANQAVIVSAVRNTENGVKLDVIFVNFDQSTADLSGHS